MNERIRIRLLRTKRAELVELIDSLSYQVAECHRGHMMLWKDGIYIPCSASNFIAEHLGESFITYYPPDED